MELLIAVIVVLLAAFSAAGVSLVIGEVVRLRGEGRQPERLSLGERFDRYLGPIDRSAAPLTPGLRVVVEFAAALCGFPGLGWMVSGRPKIGLPLLVVVPALVWALFPLFVSFTGSIFANPLAVFAVLPAMACISAGSLATCESAGSGRW